MADNGKYDEAQVAFNQHSALQPAKRGLGTSGTEPNGLLSANPARTVTEPTRLTGKYTLEFLNLNTCRPEFSPMLYKDGLVFVSAGSKRVGDPLGGRRTPFLDLFYLLKGDALLSANASERRAARQQSARE